jgi:hypothetical protein
MERTWKDFARAQLPSLVSSQKVRDTTRNLGEDIQISAKVRTVEHWNSNYYTTTFCTPPIRWTFYSHCHQNMLRSSVLKRHPGLSVQHENGTKWNLDSEERINLNMRFVTSFQLVCPIWTQQFRQPYNKYAQNASAWLLWRYQKASVWQSHAETSD